MKLLTAVLFASLFCQAQTYSVIHAFNGADGDQPLGGLVMDPAGNLYGTTEGGGVYNEGAAFQLVPGTGGAWTYNLIYSFCALASCADGWLPSNTLILDGSGNLYGTASDTLFELSPGIGGWTETALCLLPASQCVSPTGLEGTPVFDSAGNLYLLGARGTFGSVSELTPNSSGGWTETVLYDFTGGRDGMWPQSNLIFDSAGRLYGTMEKGGNKTVTNCIDQKWGCGVVFRLTPTATGWKYGLLHTFVDTDGDEPVAGLIEWKGALYGTTSRGGGNLSGAAFKLVHTATGWKESTVTSFSKTGKTPMAGVISDTAGNLYGTTILGGTFGDGVVFKLTPNAKGGWTKTILHNFSGGDGLFPASSLVFDSAGNLYGTTEAGGGTGCSGYGCGVVFEITP